MNKILSVVLILLCFSHNALSCLSGLCCDNGKIRPLNYMCSVGTSCTVSHSYCDGITPLCPTPPNLEDGTKCDGKGTCKAGKCSTEGTGGNPVTIHTAHQKELKELNKKIKQTEEQQIVDEGGDPKLSFIPYDNFGGKRSDAKLSGASGQTGDTGASSAVKKGEETIRTLGTNSAFSPTESKSKNVIKTQPTPPASGRVESGSEYDNETENEDSESSNGNKTSGTDSAQTENSDPTSSTFKAISSATAGTSGTSASASASTSTSTSSQKTSLTLQQFQQQEKEQRLLQQQQRIQQQQLEQQKRIQQSQQQQQQRLQGLQQEQQKRLQEQQQDQKQKLQQQQQQQQQQVQSLQEQRMQKQQNSTKSTTTATTASSKTQTASSVPVALETNANETVTLPTTTPQTSITTTTSLSCSFGACCSNGFIASNGFICERTTSECKHNALCQGTSPICPEPLNKNDGESCQSGRGICENGFCVTRVCFGDCCDTISMNFSEAGTKCGFGKKGSCTDKGICVIAEEFTPIFMEEQNTKIKTSLEQLHSLLNANEQYATQKAIRLQNSKQLNDQEEK